MHKDVYQVSIRPVGLVSSSVGSLCHTHAILAELEYKSAKIWFLFTRALKIFFSETTQQMLPTNSAWVCLHGLIKVVPMVVPSTLSAK